MEGTLRRAIPKILTLQTDLLTSDLSGYANVRTQYICATNDVIHMLVDAGLPVDQVQNLEHTIEDTPDLWAGARPAAPPAKIRDKMAEVFPEWKAAFEGNARALMDGTTQVHAENLDPDASDMARLIQIARAHDRDLCELESVQSCAYLAAMYDLYLDLRAGSTAFHAEQSVRANRWRWFEKIDPQYVLVGLGLMATATYAASDVLKRNSKKSKRMSAGELARLIRAQEG